MPYRRKGSKVLHKKGKRWTTKQVCKSDEAAKKAIKLLYGIERGLVPRQQKSRRKRRTP